MDGFEEISFFLKMGHFRSLTRSKSKIRKYGSQKSFDNFSFRGVGRATIIPAQVQRTPFPGSDSIFTATPDFDSPKCDCNTEKGVRKAPFLDQTSKPDMGMLEWPSGLLNRFFGFPCNLRYF